MKEKAIFFFKAGNISLLAEHQTPHVSQVSAAHKCFVEFMYSQRGRQWVYHFMYVSLQQCVGWGEGEGKRKVW